MVSGMNTPSPTPVVFVHGLWMHASSWQNWLTLFAEHGYDPSAPGWPGDASTVADTRTNPGSVANRGIAEITTHYAQVIADLPTPPIIVGHSFGGLIAQRLVGLGLARGCVVISPAQFKGILGLPLAQLQSALPVLSRPGLLRKSWSHTPASFARAFANGVSRTESDRLYDAWTIPGPCRPLFQAGLANFTPRSEAVVDTRRARGPLQLIGGGKDRTVPAATVRAAHKIQSRNSGVTELKIFDDRSHSMIIDDGWRDVADAALSFLARNGLTAGSAPATR
jgi:pimeloyl-ACP methyl ester carboxylesterase